jgi:hypothetical protein
MEEWVRVYRHELDADGVPPDPLLEETKRRAPESRRMSWQLLERFWTDVAQLDDPAAPARGAEASTTG